MSNIVRFTEEYARTTKARFFYNYYSFLIFEHLFKCQF
jgi:hypothetical protein